MSECCRILTFSFVAEKFCSSLTIVGAAFYSSNLNITKIHVYLNGCCGAVTLSFVAVGGRCART